MTLPHFKTPTVINHIKRSDFEIFSENLPIRIKEILSEFGYDLGKEEIYLDIFIMEENIREIFLVDPIEDLSVKYYDREGKVLLEICFTGIEDPPIISSFSNYSDTGILTKRLTFNFKDHIVFLD